MIREIYCKLPTDINYKLGLESTDEINNILQLIKVILGTKPNEVLGSPKFGIDLEKYLFLMNYNEEEILQEISFGISHFIRYDAQKYQVRCDVKFGHQQNDAAEYALIDIIVNEKKVLGIIVNQ